MSTTEEQDLATAADDPVDSKAAEIMEQDADRFPKAVYPAGPAASGHREEPVGNESIFLNDLEEEFSRGQRLAELYKLEQEERPADHPLVIAKAFRAETDRLADLSKEREDDETGETAGTYPGTHAGLDELASGSGYQYSQGGLTVAEKKAELEQAGIQPS